MIDGVFHFYMNAFAQTSLFILFALVIQFALRKRSNILKCYVWALVVFRLVLPFSIGTNGIRVPYPNFWQRESVVETAVPDGSAANNGNTDSDSNPDAGVPFGQVISSFNLHGGGNSLTPYRLQIIWYAGVMCFALYYLIGTCKMRRKKRRYAAAVPGETNLYEWQDNTGACVVGALRPRVYIPHGIVGRDRELIIKHEKTHIKRRDPMLKLLAFIALGCNWYNPLAWFVFYGVSLDIEKACDEQVLMGTDKTARMEYAQILVKSYGRDLPERMSILSFGKNNIKSRVKNIGKRHKRSRLLTIGVLVCCAAVLGICTALYFAKSDSAISDSANSNAGRNFADSNILKTIGNEQIGASLPQIVFADESKVAWYDYHGLFLYDIENRQLTDYVAFADTALSSAVQGDHATFVYALADGQTYYLTDEKSLLYIYENGALNRVEYSSDKIVKSKLWAIDSTRSVLSSFEYDAEADGADGTYKYLKLIVTKNGKDCVESGACYVFR